MSVNKKIIEAEATAPAPPGPPADSFNVILYTGDRPTNSGKTGVGFQPDLVFIKGRDQTDFWSVLDSNRGANVLSCDASQAESSFSGWSFDSDGFTIGSSGQANNNGTSYVAYCWRANGGTTSSNTDGSITSTVQANQDAGFSIVTWTGDGNVSTVGHGLSQAPELVITKGRANLATYNQWATYHHSLAEDHLVFLNLTNASGDAGADKYFDDSTFSNTVFGVGNDIYGPNVNGTTMVAYCFHSVSGYSKIGSYSGTSSSGNSINVGFEPDWVLIKSASAGSAWILHDTVRSDGTVHLRPNSSSGDDSGANEQINFTTTGFSIRNSGATQINTSGDTYIYMAIKISS